MRSIKRMDFYKKYTNEDSIPSCFGAFMSLLTIFTVLLFTGFEVAKYLYPPINHTVGLIQFPEDTNNGSISLNFDITFDHLPCGRNAS